jgi:hypothetical protein
MDAEQVARLAAQENEMWSGGGEWDTAPYLTQEPGAYVPLDGGERTADPPGPPPPRVEVLGIDALGTTLAFRFRWPADPARRELVLLLDFSRSAGDVIGASTWLLEYVAQRIHHDTSWFPRDVVAISEQVAVVRPARQPGQHLFGDGGTGH